MRLDAATEVAADVVTRMLLRLRNRHFFLLDLILFLVMPFIALELRVDGVLTNTHYSTPLVLYTFITLPIWVIVFVRSGLYSIYWQFASLDEMGTILKAVLVATALNSVLYYFVLRPFVPVFEDFPRSIPLLVGLLMLLVVAGVRYSVRYMDLAWRQRQFAGRNSRYTVIYGAGEAGALIVRELKTNPQLGLNPVAFLDDDPLKQHSVIYGVPVVGGGDAIEMTVRDFHLQEAIIAMPRAPGKRIREVAAEFLRHNLEVKTVPGMFELLDGSVTVNKLRNVEIDDLLRREPVATETAAVSEMLRGKRVLVTGAGGSIGGELCRQIARAGPAKLILLGHGENSLFNQSNELTAAHPGLVFETVVADIRDEARISAVMARTQPELVFHAAAHKHVWLMEQNVEDAVTNNVLGTQTVVDAALANGVGTFVMISSDKAVNPIGIMGMTKRAAELYVHARAEDSHKRYVVVRFGNVLGSRGSVVPIFKQQIAAGGPVKVTHPDVKRFFMTIPEAVQLVLQAAALGKGGEIFTLDMGEPIRIVDLATDLIRLSGLELGRDIDIEFTGLRPGEKLSEELFLEGEAYERTARDKIYVARNGVPTSVDAGEKLYAALADLIGHAQAGDEVGTRARLEQLTQNAERGAGIEPRPLGVERASGGEERGANREESKESLEMQEGGR